MTDLQDLSSFFYLSNMDEFSFSQGATSGRENRLVVGSYLN